MVRSQADLTYFLLRRLYVSEINASGGREAKGASVEILIYRGFGILSTEFSEDSSVFEKIVFKIQGQQSWRAQLACAGGGDRSY